MESDLCNLCKAVMATGAHLAFLHCCTCDCWFINTEKYNDHVLRIHQSNGRKALSAPFTCVDCQEDYFDEKAFNGHLADHEYARKKRLSEMAKPGGRINPSPFVCEDCGRDFTTQKSQRRHTRKCPTRYPCLSSNCHRTFRKIQSLIDHLESGGCKGGYNRAMIAQAICARDKKSLITVPGAQRLLGDYQREMTELDPINADLESAMDRLSLSSWGGMTPDDIGSEMSFDIMSRSGYEQEADDIISVTSDYSDLTPDSLDSSIIISNPVNRKQCKICQKIFRSVFALKNHMASAAHAPKIYHCKLSFLGQETQGAIREFKTLSGLVAHVENGSCRGGIPTFDVAIGMLNKLAEELGFSNVEATRKRLGGRLWTNEQPQHTLAT